MVSIRNYNWVLLKTFFLSILLITSLINLQAQTTNKLLVWGKHTFGQLGNGSSSPRTLPGQSTNATDWKLVSAGRAHSLAIKADGSLWSWGSSSIGQLGNGTIRHSSIPLQIGSDIDWSFISAGKKHNLALKSDGTLWSWGENSVGELGHNGSIFVLTQVGNDSDWTFISAGKSYSMAVKKDGTLWAWGENSAGQLGDGTTLDKSSPVQVGNDTNWKSVVAGAYHSLAVKKDGTLWGWGQNESGQLGDATKISSSIPVRVGNESDWSLVAAGDYHSVAIKIDGTLWAWGANLNNTLGDGTSISRTVPVQIGNDTDWSMLSVKGDNSLAMKTDGTLWAWGSNEWGQLGDGTITSNTAVPVQVGNGTNWAAISISDSHSLAIKIDGTLWAWGYSHDGQLGDGVVTPAGIDNDNNWVSVSAGNGRSLGIKSDGTLWTWGLNGDNPSANIPVQVGSDNNWQSVVAGYYHRAAIKNDGTLWAWGENTYGQLGDGTYTDKAMPVQVGRGTRWKSIAMGTHHSVAIKDDGTLWAWGRNDFGQIGDKSYKNQSSPVQISSDTNWKLVTAGGNHGLGLQTDGTLWAWGRNNFGQLGDGTFFGKSIPAKIGIETNWASVSTGDFHTLGLKSDGTLWAWGYNIDPGLLGNGTNDYQVTPVQVGAHSNWEKIAAGIYHSMAIKSDNTLWGWGNNSYGQLGDGSITGREVPTQIGSASNWHSITAGEFYSLGLTGAISSQATLSDITFSAGVTSPSFAPGITSYSIAVDNTISSITLVPTASNNLAVITVNGKEIASGEVSESIAVSVGDNKIIVVVNAPEGSNTYVFTVIREGLAPVMAEIGNKIIDELTALSFNALATDADEGQSLSYSLLGAPAGATIHPSTGAFSWTPIEAQGPETYTFTIKVTDNAVPALSDEKPVTVTINEVNLNPVLSAINDASTSCGQSISFIATAADADLPENSLTFSLQDNVPAGASINLTTGAFIWTPDDDQLGNYKFVIRVTDNGSPTLHHEQTFNLKLEDLVAPIAIARDISIYLNAEGTAGITALQLDGGSTDNCSISSYTINKTSFSCMDIGANTVVLTVKDAAGNTSSANALVTVSDSIQPVIVAQQVFVLDENTEAGTTAGTVSATDNCSLSGWTITGGNTNEAFVVNADGLLTVNNAGALDYESTPEFQLHVAVTDRTGNVAEETLVIQLNNRNEKPVLHAIDDLEENEQTLIHFTATAEDVDVASDELIFSLGENAPAGATLDAATGEFKWTPTEEQGPQVYTFLLAVSDGELMDEQEVSITVSEVNHAPVITSEPVTAAKAGEAYEYGLVAIDADLPENMLHYQAISIPAWLHFNPATQLLSGTPDDTQEAGSYTVQLKVSDGFKTVVQQFELLLEQQEMPTGLFGSSAESFSISVYPNPTPGRINIGLEGTLSGGVLNFSLYDLNGRLLLQQKGSMAQGTERVSDFLEVAKAGIYLLRLQDRDKLSNLRINKQ